MIYAILVLAIIILALILVRRLRSMQPLIYHDDGSVSYHDSGFEIREWPDGRREIL